MKPNIKGAAVDTAYYDTMSWTTIDPLPPTNHHIVLSRNSTFTGPANQ